MPFCPLCKAEYSPGTKRCPDCECDLVEELPEEADLEELDEEVPEGLTEDHWSVINFMRQYYLEMGTPPPVRMIARRTGCSLRQMQRLFPSGLTHGACKIAGIPRDAISPRFLYP